MTFLRRSVLVFLVLVPVFAFAQSADQEVVSVVDAPDPVIPGQTLTYTITLTNHGPNAAVNGGINVSLPGEVTYQNTVVPAGFTCSTFGNSVTCSNPSFAPGTVQFVMSVTVAPHLINFPDGSFVATFTPSGTTPDPVPANNQKTATTNYSTQQIDLAIAVADNPDPVGPNGNITYTVDVTNAGPDTATDVSFNSFNNGTLRYQSITIPSGWSCPALPAVNGNPTFTCTTPTMAPGTAQFIVVVKAPDGLFDGTLTHVFNVSGTGDDTNDGNSQEIEQTAYVAPDSDIVVTASDSPDPVTPDGDITYTVTVQNLGPDAAPNVVLTVPMNNTLRFQSVAAPAGWSCTPPAVGAGTTWSCSIATLPVQPASTFTIVLRANDEQFGINDQTINQVFAANSGNADPNGDNNLVQVSTLYSTIDANVSITASDAPDPVTNGGNLTFTVNATNAGPDAGPNASVILAPHPSLVFQSVVAPAGWTCTTPAVGAAGATQCTKASMASAETAQFTLVTQLIAAGAGGTLNSNFSIGTGAQDPVPANNAVEVFTNWIGQASDLALDKVTLQSTAAQGGTITYTLYTANNGPNDVTNVTVTDVLPSQLLFQSITPPAGWTCMTPAAGTNGTVTCTIPLLANGAAAQFTLVTTVAPNATGAIANSATIGGAGNSDPNPGNSGGASAPVAVAGNADLGVTKTTAATSAPRGSTITYTITVANTGPEPAASVVMTDVLPAQLLFQSIAAPAGWTCATPAAGTNGTVTCTAATLAASTSAVFTLTTTVSPNATGTITNAASAAHSGADANPGNGSGAAAALPVPAAVADVAVAKATAQTSVMPGQTFSYAIAFTNNGPDAAASPLLTDTLPASLLFQSIAAPAGWTCTTPAVGATGTITCNAATIASGASANFTLNVQVAPGATGTITNRAVVTSAETDSNPINSDVTTAPLPVTPAGADLSIVKTTATATTTVGTVFGYTITVNNAGPANAAAVTVNDTLPAGLEFVSATPSQGTCNAVSPIVCNLGGLASGASATIALQVRAIAPGNVVNTATVTAAEDTANGNNSDAAPTVEVIGGPGDEAQIPTLSEWALIALMGMLAVAAPMRMRT